MTQELTLVTARLVLRPSNVEHAELLSPGMRDAELTRYLAWAPHIDVEETRAVLRSMQQAQAQGLAYHWTVFVNDDACGVVSLIDVRRRHRLWVLQRAEIAYWVAPVYQDRGIATEALSAVIAAAFGPLELNRLIVSHTSANAASGRIPRKLGFRFVGCEQHYFCKDGEWFDMNHYELLRDDWLARSSPRGTTSSHRRD
jgi:ribosomal-protein-alanine N-acetyltransferase